MISGHVTIKKVRMDPGWSQELAQGMARLAMEAARVWLATIINHSSKTFPVQTGMAKASLRPLARYLGMSVSITPTRKPYKGHSIPLGEALGGSSPFHKAIPEAGGTVSVSFDWPIGVDHFYWNDFFPHNYGPDKLSTPWQFIKDANKAYEEYVVANWKKYVPILMQVQANGRSS
jgi:hypothetical protein